MSHPFSVAKNAFHWIATNSIPSSPTIVTIAGGVCWLSYRVSMARGQGWLNEFYDWQVGCDRSGWNSLLSSPCWNAFGFSVATYEFTPKLAWTFSIGTSYCTSLTLNIIASKFFKQSQLKEESVEIDIKEKQPTIDSEENQEKPKEQVERVIEIIISNTPTLDHLEISHEKIMA